MQLGLQPSNGLRADQPVDDLPAAVDDDVVGKKVTP